jgi:murein DD-endopeptidase MepM/ murein hydrolase activator NlpD
LRLPKGSAPQVDAALAKVPAEIRASSRMHRVEAGESLAAIANRYSASVKAIAAVNSIAGDQPAAGDQLVIPAAYREVSTPAARAVKSSVKSSRKSATTVTARKKGSTSAVAVAAVKAPVHKSAGTVAQLSHKTSALNR